MNIFQILSTSIINFEYDDRGGDSHNGGGGGCCCSSQ